MMDYIDRTAVIEPPQKSKLLDYIAGLNVIVWKHVSMFINLEMYICTHK